MHSFVSHVRKLCLFSPSSLGDLDELVFEKPPNVDGEGDGEDQDHVEHGTRLVLKRPGTRNNHKEKSIIFAF